MIRMRIGPLAALALIALLVVTACGGGGGSAAPTDTPTTAPGVSTSTRAPGQPAATPTPTRSPTPVVAASKRGGTVRSPTRSTPTGLDPFLPGASSQYMWDPGYSGLVMFRSLSFADPEIIGDLAVSWTIGDSAKTWTFKLDPRARFQNIAPVNGRPVTAKDVKWVYDKRIDLNYQNVDRTLASQVASVEAPDDTTVIFRMKDPTSQFLATEAYRSLPITAREIFERDGNFNKTSVGSGPFILRRYDTSIKSVFERNSNYWKTDAQGQALPYLDVVETVIINDEQVHAAALRSGLLDFAAPLGVDASVVGTVRGVPNLIVEKSHALGYWGYTFNITRKPLDDIRVRQAFLKATDVNQISSVLVGDANAPYESFISAGVTDFPYPQEKLKRHYTRDVAGAKRLLAEAGYPNGVKLDSFLKGITAAAGVDFMVLLQQQWAEAGITINIVSLEGTATTQRRTRGDYDIIFTAGSVGTNPTNILVGFTKEVRGPTPWLWTDPRIDALTLEARGTTDQAKLRQIVERAQDVLWEGLPQIPHPQPVVYQVTQINLKGFKNHWSAGNKGLEFAWLEKK